MADKKQWWRDSKFIDDMIGGFFIFLLECTIIGVIIYWWRTN